jgi:hypothetical protein
MLRAMEGSMSTIGKIEGERMAALACINRVLLRAAELDWESSSLDDLEKILEEMKKRLEAAAPWTSQEDSALRRVLASLRGATSRLNAVADVMKTPTDFGAQMPGLVTRATAVAGQVARIRNGRH